MKGLSRGARGFTLIELMIVIVILGILATIGMSNIANMLKRAKEGATKANMHTLQIAVEDYGITNDGKFATDMDATHIANLLPASFKNPFSQLQGVDVAWENRTNFAGPAANVPGIASYADSSNVMYNVKGHGSDDVLGMILTSGT